jgi:propionate CoA-transferase
MSAILKARMLWRLLQWKRNCKRWDLAFRPKTDNPKFLSARDAAALVPDDAVVMSTGLAGTMRPAILYRAIRERFQGGGHPTGLTWIAAGGAGGRGMIPGTVEEIALDGLCTRFITGHFETSRAHLKLADAGRCELAVLPQGTITHLAAAQAKGEDSLLSDVGVGTFIDPRVGTGTQVAPGVGEMLVAAEGDRLRYRLPKITAAVVVATAADAEGNLYMDGAPMYGETREASLAAKANGGVALAVVARIVPKDPDLIFLAAEHVDAVVLHPKADLAIGVPMNAAWPEYLPGAKCDVRKAAKRAKAMNAILKLDPERGPVDSMLARQTADLFSRIAEPGGSCIIGYGLPQEVGRLVEAGGLGRDVTFLIETGVYGGTPAPGLFFGMGVNPERLMTSAEMFSYCEEHLDVTILGMLQVDGEGNVNVSKKAEGARNYVGPGGFLNLVASAKTIVFVGAFTAKSQMAIADGRLRVLKPGIPKFVEQVDEVTFSARAALAAGKRVFYVTPVGAFRLTAKGLELIQVTPGIDIERDIRNCSQAALVLPRDGAVPLVDASVVTGRDFRLSWRRDPGLDGAPADAPASDGNFAPAT